MHTLPDGVLTYLLGRNCESEQFFEMASETVGGAAPGYEQVVALCDWIQNNVRFNPTLCYVQMTAGT